MPLEESNLRDEDEDEVTDLHYRHVLLSSSVIPTGPTGSTT